MYMQTFTFVLVNCLVSAKPFSILFSHPVQLGRRSDGGYLASSQGEATKNDDDKVKFLWVRIRGMANKACMLVAVCHRPCNQDEEVNELFSKKLASRSSALVLLGDFNLPDGC